MMRIIAGTAGGISLEVPKGDTRPTTDRVRESVFSSLGQLVEGCRVLDLFAGSGALGLESLSRGAEQSVFVDQSRQACCVIRKNLAKTNLSASASVINQSVESYLKRAQQTAAQFDLIFADPPYQKDAATLRQIEALFSSESLLAITKPDGLLVFESASKQSQPNSPNWTATNSRQYGETLITYFTKR